MWFCGSRLSVGRCQRNRPSSLPPGGGAAGARKVPRPRPGGGSGRVAPCAPAPHMAMRRRVAAPAPSRRPPAVGCPRPRWASAPAAPRPPLAVAPAARVLRAPLTARAARPRCSPPRRLLCGGGASRVLRPRPRGGRWRGAAASGAFRPRRPWVRLWPPPAPSARAWF